MAIVHGRSWESTKFFRNKPAALAVYWVYLARQNRENVAWPSLRGLKSSTGWCLNSCKDARDWLESCGALERVNNYIRPQWRNLPKAKLRQKLALDQSIYYRPTGKITIEGKTYPLLYVPGDENGEGVDEDNAHVSPDDTSESAVPMYHPIDHGQDDTELSTMFKLDSISYSAKSCDLACNEPFDSRSRHNQAPLEDDRPLKKMVKPVSDGTAPIIPDHSDTESVADNYPEKVVNAFEDGSPQIDPDPNHNREATESMDAPNSGGTASDPSRMGSDSESGAERAGNTPDNRSVGAPFDSTLKCEAQYLKPTPEIVPQRSQTLSQTIPHVAPPTPAQPRLLDAPTAPGYTDWSTADPGDYNLAELKRRVKDTPPVGEQWARLLELEKAGKARRGALGVFARTTMPREIMAVYVDAIREAFGWAADAVTEQNWSLMRNSAKQLWQANIQPSDIQDLHRYCKRQGWNGGFTPAALPKWAAQWDAQRRQRQDDAGGDGYYDLMRKLEQGQSDD